ncbi:unnamed protein product [Discula destructiva]
MTSRSRRQFAPLQAGAGASSDLPKLKGVVFDVDGTLCQPQNYMFAQMRTALGITAPTDILDHIYSLPTPAAREEAMDSVRAIERTAMTSQAPQPGLVELMTYLDTHALPKGICTRNFDAPVNHLLTKFLYPSGVQPLHPIVTREFRPPKPSPAGILHIARSWGLTKSSGGGGGDGGGGGGANEAGGAVVDGEKVGVDAEGGRHADVVTSEGTGDDAPDASGLIMVGDSIDDMTAGRRAGAATVLLVNPANEHLAEHEHTDLVVRRLDELIGVLEAGFTGREI